GIAGRAFGDRRIGKAVQAFVGVIRIGGGEAVEFVVGRVEVSVLHAEWLEDAGAEEFVEGLAGDYFDEASEDVDAETVFPTISGIEEKRNGGETLDVVFDGAVVREQAVRYVGLDVERT